MTGWMAIRVVVLAVFAFLLAPVIIVVIASFNGGPILSFPPQEFTLRWFTLIKPSFVDGLYVSLIVATSTALLSIVFGVPAVLALSRGSFPGRDALNSVLLSPLMVPALVTGVALYQFSLVFWDLTHITLSGTIMGLIIGHLTFGIPFVARAARRSRTFRLRAGGSCPESGRNADADLLACYRSGLASEHNFRRHLCIHHVPR
jgi:putative spermidine/putrescine transport system permease protein